ncbi:MAG: replicative DNA helicase [Planctomycetota bacterium]
MNTIATDNRRRLADPDAEAAVLGSILVDPHDRETVHDVFEILSPDDFDDKRHERIFRGIRTVWDQGYAVDFVTVGDELDRSDNLRLAGGREYLQTLTDRVPTSTNLLRHSQIVRDYSVLRQLNLVGNEITELSKNPPPTEDQGGVRGLLDIAESKIFEIANREQSGTMRAMKDQLTPAMERIMKIRDRSARHTGIETGFFDLDDLTTGFQPGQLVIVAGRPGMGKTAFALNVAVNAATSYLNPSGGRPKIGVALFSMEMGSDELTNRILCSDAGVDSHALRTGRLPTEQLSYLSDAAGRLSQANVWIDDSATQTPFTIRARARRLKARGELNLVIVDYLQLITAPGHENRVQEISSISRSLKSLARELRVPVIALSQLNRSTEKEERRPRMADLRESGSIEQDADVVLLLYREEVYKRTEDNAGKAELIIAKQRNGPTDTVMLAFDSASTRFRNLAYGRGE